MNGKTPGGRGWWLCLLLGLVLAGNVQAQQASAEPGSARAQLQAFADGLRSLQARFRQMVRAADGAVVDSGTGQLWLQTPDRMRWQYEGEFPELIVADGRELWLYDQTLEQVTVKPQAELTGNSPLMLLTNPGGLDQQFQLAELGTVDGLSFLELTALETDSEFDRVMIGFRDGMPANMALEDAFGMRTDIEFTELVRNPELEPHWFEFEPPPGTDVVGDRSGAADAAQ